MLHWVLSRRSQLPTRQVQGAETRILFRAADGANTEHNELNAKQNNRFNEIQVVVCIYVREITKTVVC